jgi:hypothetical protein
MRMSMMTKMNDSGYVYADNITPIYVEVDNAELQFDLTVESESYECLHIITIQN